MFDPFQDWNPHFFWKQHFNLILLSTSSRKNISIQGLKDALGVGVGAEGAEYDDLKEANIVKMDNLFETELETSDKEAENYKCAICQKMNIDDTELCDVEGKTSLRRTGKTILVPIAKNSLATAKKLTRKMSLPSAENFLAKVKA